jgi:hypothetical protein
VAEDNSSADEQRKDDGNERSDHDFSGGCCHAGSVGVLSRLTWSSGLFVGTRVVE